MNITIANKYKKELENCEDKSTLMDGFIEKVVQTALKNVKKGKVAGTGGVLTEFIKNLDPRSRSWLTRFFTLWLLKRLTLKYGVKQKL